MSICRALNSFDSRGFLQYVRSPAHRAIYWVPTNQPWFVSLIQLSFRRAGIFRMASLAFTAVGWQTEQQRGRRRHQRSICTEGVNVPEAWRRCAEKRKYLEDSERRDGQSRGRRRPGVGSSGISGITVCDTHVKNADSSEWIYLSINYNKHYGLDTMAGKSRSQQVFFLKQQEIWLQITELCKNVSPRWFSRY